MKILENTIMEAEISTIYYEATLESIKETPLGNLFLTCSNGCKVTIVKGKKHYYSDYRPEVNFLVPKRRKAIISAIFNEATIGSKYYFKLIKEQHSGKYTVCEIFNVGDANGP
jgi:hypothetical protein